MHNSQLCKEIEYEIALIFVMQGNQHNFYLEYFLFKKINRMCYIL